MQENEELKDEDIKVLEFLSKYKMLKIEDASFIYKRKRYYRQRINRLIDRGYVKRYKCYVIINRNGRKYLGKSGTSYIKNIDNEAYMERLKAIASIAAITINSNVEFIPSWDIKERDKFTETARRYIGKMIIDSKEYLIYYITAKKEHVYIKQLLFDVNKSINSQNIIIFTENFEVINKNYNNLVFGKENTFVILNNKENKELLKKYEDIDIHELLESIYGEELLISNWNNADYLLEDNTYIVSMPFINTERIARINWFFEENTELQRKVEIVTLKENKSKIRELLVDKCSIKTFDKDLLGGLSETQENQ